MRQMILTIEENLPMTETVYRLILTGKDLEPQLPGQFVNIALPGLFLRRPISVCDQQGDRLTLMYKTVGQGTRLLASLRPGETLDVLTGLGNGYDLSKAGDRPLLLGGGVGVPPLVLLARRLREAGRPVAAVLGFNTGAEVFGADALRALGCEVTLATADGSQGVPGFVTDALPASYSFFYACGPEPMLRAVCRVTETSGQLSLEQRMGCGFGACMGCTVQTVNGPKRICREGPVLGKEEIVWDA